MNILQYINFDPIIQNNESYGSETTYVESGKVATVHFKFNHMGDTPKKWREINGGMSIGAPIISFIFYGHMEFLLSCFLLGIVCFRHKENIFRLVKGKEPKIFEN